MPRAALYCAVLVYYMQCGATLYIHAQLQLPPLVKVYAQFVPCITMFSGTSSVIPPSPICSC